ncbi:MAG: class I SAM-dependent methyltransferase [Saccharofermentanales bacterium]
MDINKIKGHWYASIYDQQENQTDDIDLLLSILSDDKNGFADKRILEVCCGGGRILVPLAKAGYDVVGFDMDDDMMSMIPEKIGGMTNIRFYQADALKSDWGKDYDVVILAGNIMINIETDGDYKEAQQQFIRKAADALKVNGHSYVDFNLLAHPENFFNASSERIHFEGYDNRGVYGRCIGCGGTYDAKTQMTDGKGRIEITLQNGETFSFVKKSVKYIPTLTQVHEWLTMSGFVIKQEYGDFNKNPISETTNRAIIYARKER